MPKPGPRTSARYSQEFKATGLNIVRPVGGSHAADASELRVLQPRPAGGCRWRDDLFVRVHVLHVMRGDGAARDVPELRGRFQPAPVACGGAARQVPAVGGARVQAGWLREGRLSLALTATAAAPSSAAAGARARRWRGIPRWPARGRRWAWRGSWRRPARGRRRR
jgi:hypothetical protein